MFCHFHQCNQLAQSEVGAELNETDRKKELIRIFREIFPFLQTEFCLLERSMAQLMHLLVKEDHHQPLLASLSNTIIHAPGGNPLHAPEDVQEQVRKCFPRTLSTQMFPDSFPNTAQGTFFVRFGEYLNYLRHNDLDSALELERQMVELDSHNLHVRWRERIIAMYREYNPNFPENFKIKCKTKKIELASGEVVEQPDPDSFLCMLDYFRNILVHLPLKGNLK